MASSAGWLKGKVKAVTSGDTLVIMALNPDKTGIPREKTITLSSLMAPRLARRDGVDEPFAWYSREFLRQLCLGEEVVFKVDYVIKSIGRDFGSVFLAKSNDNVAKLVVSQGWAKVREPQSQPTGPRQGQQKQIVEVSPYLEELLSLEEKAKTEGLGCWTKVPGAAEESIRCLPPNNNFDAMSLLAENKGQPMEAIVEQVRDGSTLGVYLLPEFQFVRVFVAGTRAPSMKSSHGTKETVAVAEAFALESKFFTEARVLNRDVHIVLQGVDKFRNLIWSVYYPDGESEKDLGLELVENGYAKYVESSANLMEEDAKKQLKAAELEAKKSKLRMWTNYVPPATGSKPIHDKNFTGKVVEVVSGDCIIVADDSLPSGSPLAERRVNLSSIWFPKMHNPRRDEKPAPYAREAKELLRTRLIGSQVSVQLEYSRKAGQGGAMDFGSVFVKAVEKDASGQVGGNVAELMVARGLGTVVKHRDFEERSHYYDALLAAESRAIAGKKGIHSSKEAPVMHTRDLTTEPAKKASEFLPFLQRNRKIPAIVEYVLSGHRFKLFLPKETCSIAFSFSGVRCPRREEPFSDEAIAVMRRKIMQREVEIEVESVDKTGTFLGTLWESGTNMSIALVGAGLAKYTPFGNSDRILDAHLLEQAQKSAKQQKLKIWENYDQGQEVSKKQKKVLNVVVTEILDSGKFYVQTTEDQTTASIQQQLASLNLQESDPVTDTDFKPTKGDIVLAQFSADNSWNRAMIVNAPRAAVESSQDEYEVFYIDYGNQEVVPFSQLRPLDSSLATAPGLAQLCSLAYVKVPSLEDNFGEEAAEYLSEQTLSSSIKFRALIEGRDLSEGKVVKGQGTGPALMVTLEAGDDEMSINAAMVREGLASLDKEKKFWKSSETLREFQDEARTYRRGMWEDGDIDAHVDRARPITKTAGKR
ncbi:putative micrococcal nuclease [Rosa chinensis]|uniref:Ribonuclease n=1 Tax=Rosa chinensis TaxID=74649 RepID=A0A2P6PXP4_ROSCH|nr:putative micrococcal nuclease [Rosa chinensis]